MPVSECSTLSHSMSKFVPEPVSYYMCTSIERTSAWCDLTNSNKAIKRVFVNSFNPNIVLPINQWKAIIMKIEDHTNPVEPSDLLEVLVLSNKKPEAPNELSSIIKTPKKVQLTLVSSKGENLLTLKLLSWVLWNHCSSKHQENYLQVIWRTQLKL